MKPKLLAEFLGTFGLVFAGTGAIVIDHGDVSGAHLNPAVTFALASAGRFTFRHVPAFVAVQIAGALAASGLLRLLFPADATLGSTLPASGAIQSLILEVVLTFLLCWSSSASRRCAGERHHRRHRHRGRDCFGGHVCRTD